jgi:hypothetical protein
MDEFTKALITRIDLLKRVETEHDPIVLRSYEVGGLYDGDRKVGTRHAFEENKRLLRTAETCEAARLELQEIYRTLEVTDDMPAYVVVEVLDVRLKDQGVIAWCDKIRRLGGPNVPHVWLSEYHVDLVRRRGHGIDDGLRVALILEDGYEQSLVHAEAQADEDAANSEAA